MPLYNCLLSNIKHKQPELENELYNVENNALASYFGSGLCARFV